jgi:hypothetical protein
MPFARTSSAGGAADPSLSDFADDRLVQQARHSQPQAGPGRQQHPLWLRRWLTATVTDDEFGEQLVHEVLALAQESKSGTIDQVLAMDEFELGWAALARTLRGRVAQPVTPADSTTESDPERLATRIDARMAELAAAGLDDRAIFEAMADHMPAMKRLFNDDKLLDLCRRHPGLDRYVGIVEAMMLKLLTAAKEDLSRHLDA